MCQFHTHNTVTFFGGIEGDVQIAVGSTSGTILLDAQGCGVDVPGHLRPNYGTARLSYSTARELRDFLDDELTDPRQPSLSSNATFTKPVIPPCPWRTCQGRGVAGLISLALLEAWETDLDPLSIPRALARWKAGKSAPQSKSS